MGFTFVKNNISWNKNDNLKIINSNGFIQGLIDNASNGETIFIPIGTYYENIIINKSINLVGENKNLTIIDGNYIGIVVTITSNWVNISGFTIKNSRIDYSEYIAGINIYSKYNTISNNIISDNNFGIFDNDDNNTFVDNIIFNNWFGIGSINSCYNNVEENTISNNTYGIGFVNSSSINIKNNSISNNLGEAIFLSYFNSSNVVGNDISNNDFGIYLDCGKNNLISDNIILNNYFGISLNGLGCKITNNIIKTNDNGIGLFDSSNIIYHNNFINNIELNAFDTSDNTWDDGKYGNFWSDYKQKYPDAKPKLLKPWMWDTPYNIETGNNKDMCPLVKQWPESFSVNTFKNKIISLPFLQSIKFNTNLFLFCQSIYSGLDS
jgi:parallel beta-helix repeat protein